MMGRWGRIGKQLLDDFKEKRGHWKLKEEALDITRTHFGRGYGPVTRQTEWMNEWTDFLVEELETLQNYQTDSQVSILALAFANDLILLADNHHDGQNLLAHMKSHLTK
jgi:hypothetical protein